MQVLIRTVQLGNRCPGERGGKRGVVQPVSDAQGAYRPVYLEKGFIKKYLFSVDNGSISQYDKVEC